VSVMSGEGRGEITYKRKGGRKGRALKKKGGRRPQERRRSGKKTVDSTPRGR